MAEPPGYPSPRDRPQLDQHTTAKVVAALSQHGAGTLETVAEGAAVHVHTSSADEPVVVELRKVDDPDGTPDLRFQLHDVVLSGARSIVVDASSLDAIPSAAIAAMLTAHRACRRRGGRLMIRHPSRRALDQLARTGLWRVLEVERR